MDKPCTITENKITLSNYKYNKTGYGISFGLMCLTICLPILAFILILATGSRLSVGFFFFTAAFGFIAYFFYRLATWNKHGREHFEIEGNQLIYQPEAKNISFQKYHLDIETLTIKVYRINELVHYNGEHTTLAKIQFITVDKQFENNIKTPMSIIREILNQLEIWGISVELDFEELHDV